MSFKLQTQKIQERTSEAEPDIFIGYLVEELSLLEAFLCWTSLRNPDTSVIISLSSFMQWAAMREKGGPVSGEEPTLKHFSLHVLVKGARSGLRFTELCRSVFRCGASHRNLHCRKDSVKMQPREPSQSATPTFTFPTDPWLFALKSPE